MRADKALLIQEALFSIPEFKQAHAILFYAGFGSEVPTHDMMQLALESGKRVILPITDTETKALILREVRDLESLEHNVYGIPEPVPENTYHYEPGSIDLVLVPGIVFDHCGHRVGYGGGYYDRFLESIDESVPRVAIAFDLQIVDEIPNEAHDLPVYKIVTESRVIDAL